MICNYYQDTETHTFSNHCDQFISMVSCLVGKICKLIVKSIKRACAQERLIIISEIVLKKLFALENAMRMYITMR